MGLPSHGLTRCVCMSVYIHIHTHMCVCVCVCIYIYTHTYSIYVYMYTYVYIHACVYVYICVYIYIYIYIYIYVCVCIYRHIYRHIHIYIHVRLVIFLPAKSKRSISSHPPLPRAFVSWGADSHLGLYTILLLPILYGIWHTKGRSRGVVYCPIAVQQYCNSVGNAGGPEE